MKQRAETTCKGQNGGAKNEQRWEVSGWSKKWLGVLRGLCQRIIIVAQGTVAATERPMKEQGGDIFHCCAPSLTRVGRILCVICVCCLRPNKATRISDRSIESCFVTCSPVMRLKNAALSGVALKLNHCPRHGYRHPPGEMYCTKGSAQQAQAGSSSSRNKINQDVQGTF